MSAREYVIEVEIGGGSDPWHLAEQVARLCEIVDYETACTFAPFDGGDVLEIALRLRDQRIATEVTA